MESWRRRAVRLFRAGGLVGRPPRRGVKRGDPRVAAPSADGAGTRRPVHEKSPQDLPCGLSSRNNAGSDLLSHALSHAVPSAVSGLTSVFGMGTGVTLIL